MISFRADFDSRLALPALEMVSRQTDLQQVVAKGSLLSLRSSARQGRPSVPSDIFRYYT